MDHKDLAAHSRATRTPLRQLTAEEVECLREYANKYGRQWKSKLRDAWMSATEIGTVYALRNDPGFGPRGLVAFRFPSAGSAQAWNVYLNGKCIDTVFYSRGANVDADEIKRSLVGHDGYDANITVRRCNR